MVSGYGIRHWCLGIFWESDYWRYDYNELFRHVLYFKDFEVSEIKKITENLAQYDISSG